MVKKEDLLYLFIGQDYLSKDTQIRKLKETLLPKDSRDFNLDILYAKELNLKTLQERLLSLALKSKNRLLIIKDAHNLKEDARNFLLEYLDNRKSGTVVVLDMDKEIPDENFMAPLKKHARVYRFQEEPAFNTFDLLRQIEAAKTASSLRILNQLLREGVRPELILGGLRSMARYSNSPLKSKKIMRLLLNCDVAVKTSALNPAFALEKLVVSLCGLSGFGKPLR
jgi:DNA polymerase III delta subunit